LQAKDFTTHAGRELPKKDWGFVKLKVKMTTFSIVLGSHRDKNSSDFVFDHASDSMRAANTMTLTETKIIVANIDRLLSKTSRT